MNVIFLDVDGVLNTYHSSLENLRLLDEGIDFPNILIEKVKILSEIAKEFDCKIVLSSSWKLNYEYYDFNENKIKFNVSVKYLLKLFEENDIDFIGVTPNVKKIINNKLRDEMWKENDIAIYLLSHPEVEHFVIIDDENYDLKALEDYLALTDYFNEDKEKEGLCYFHKEKIRKILAKDVYIDVK